MVSTDAPQRDNMDEKMKMRATETGMTKKVKRLVLALEEFKVLDELDLPD